MHRTQLFVNRPGLPRIKRHPDDLEARLDCQLAVWLAMTGRQGGIEMEASHAIGHVLGGTCDVPHGYPTTTAARSRAGLRPK